MHILGNFSSKFLRPLYTVVDWVNLVFAAKVTTQTLLIRPENIRETCKKEDCMNYESLAALSVDMRLRNVIIQCAWRHP